MSWFKKLKEKREKRKKKRIIKQRLKACSIYDCWEEIPKDPKRRYCDNHRENCFNGELICSICTKADTYYTVNSVGYCTECYEKKCEEELRISIVRLWKQNISSIDSWDDMAKIIVDNAVEIRLKR